MIADVSVVQRAIVFQEYGIANTHPEDHEIDYLIAPRQSESKTSAISGQNYRTREWNPLSLAGDQKWKLSWAVNDRGVT